jgi:hypothetical protein
VLVLGEEGQLRLDELAVVVVLVEDDPSASLLLVDDAPGYVRLAVVVVAFALLAALVNRVGGLQHGRADLRTAGRATVQLAIVGLLIAAVLMIVFRQRYPRCSPRVMAEAETLC